MPNIQVHWFRNDLRLQDQQALQYLQQVDFFIPVYIIDPRMYRQHVLGFAKTGHFRMKFLLETLQDLHFQLQQLGSRLLVFTGYPEQILPELARMYSPRVITASKEYTTDEIKLEQKLGEIGLQIQYYHDLTLIHPDDLPFGIEQLPDSFTPFRKAVEKSSAIRPPLPAPEWLPPLPERLPLTIIPPLSQLGMIDTSVEKGLHFEGGTSKGLQRMQYYFFDSQLLSKYKETRNGLLGMDYSSKLSPWLSVGALSPRMIWQEVKNYECKIKANESTYWLIFELLWRDYFKYVAMKYGHKIFLETGLFGIKRPSGENMAKFNAWCEGKTGNDFVDANMIELKTSGFMSNRGRQNVASFLCKDLGINWTWGAAWFESRLIDYDPASNWGNWLYVAGVGNDPRENRYFNTNKQAMLYDPDGEFRAYWLQGISQEQLK